MTRRTYCLVVLLACLAAACSGEAPAGTSAARTGGIRTTVVRYGPFSVPPASGESAHEHQGADGSGVLSRVLLDVPKPCDGCWITGFRPELTEPDGTRIDAFADVMLHHFVLANGVPSCGATASADPRFFAAGSELTPGSLPRGYGLRVAEGDRWGAAVELMNMGGNARLVYVDVAFDHTVVPQRRVVPLWLDVGGCRRSAYSVPRGRSVRDRTYALGVGGDVVAAAGHLHAGGVRVAAVDETTGETICTSRPTASPSRIRAMTVCRGDPIAVVHRGDLVRVSSVYDAPRPQGGVMGIQLVYVAPRGRPSSG